MIQRFLIATIVGFLFLTSQIAVAADIDWNSAPRIGSKAEFARYIESERRKGYTTFHLILTNEFRNGFRIDNKEDFANLALCIDVNGTWHINTDGTAQMTYKITEYPGTRVANAYLSSNQQQAWMNLTNEEQKLYNIAVSIVDEANKRLTEVEKARYIHDEICKRVDYRSQTNQDAFGALVIKVTNCQGYSDAFYMLGRMSGLEVGRIRAHINENNENHALNTITFSDGRTYLVDATNDDTNNTNILFCSGRETMQRYFTCEWEIIPNLQWKNYE